MRNFIKLFNTVMTSVSDIDIAMLANDAPIVNWENKQWVEFTTWANKALSPNIVLGHTYATDNCVCAKIVSTFNKKSASTLNAHFNDWFITNEPDFDDDGAPLGYSLYLNIPYDVYGI